MYANYVLAEDLESGVKGAKFVRILRALGSGPLAVSAISKPTGIRLTNLPWYLGRPTEYDLIEKKEGNHSIKDTVVRDYFARRDVQTGRCVGWAICRCRRSSPFPLCFLKLFLRT
jgi:hypothetical protein